MTNIEKLSAARPLGYTTLPKGNATRTTSVIGSPVTRYEWKYRSPVLYERLLLHYGLIKYLILSN